MDARGKVARRGWGIRAAALCVAMVAGCADPEPATPVVMATRLTAELVGQLVEEKGCLRIVDERGTGRALVWPDGIEVERVGNVITATDTLMGEQATWQVGSMVWLGGGEVGRPDDGRAGDCPGPYWIVGGLEMPGTARNLRRYLEFGQVGFEETGDTIGVQLGGDGIELLVDGHRLWVYDCLNADVARSEAEQALAAVGPRTRVYRKDRLIVIDPAGAESVSDLLRGYMGEPLE